MWALPTELLPAAVSQATAVCGNGGTGSSDGSGGNSSTSTSGGGGSGGGGGGTSSSGAGALTGWASYCEQRRLPLHSPAPLLLHFPLTLVWALQQLAGSIPWREGPVTVYYLGKSLNESWPQAIPGSPFGYWVLQHIGVATRLTARGSDSGWAAVPAVWPAPLQQAPCIMHHYLALCAAAAHGAALLAQARGRS